MRVLRSATMGALVFVIVFCSENALIHLAQSPAQLPVIDGVITSVERYSENDKVSALALTLTASTATIHVMAYFDETWNPASRHYMKKTTILNSDGKLFDESTYVSLEGRVVSVSYVNPAIVENRLSVEATKVLLSDRDDASIKGQANTLAIAVLEKAAHAAQDRSVVRTAPSARTQRPVSSRTASAQAQSPRRRVSLDEEAQQEAQRYWNRALTQCGDSYYTKSYLDPQSYAKLEPYYISDAMRSYSVFQMKGTRVVTEGAEAKPVQLSEADILNGAKPGKGGDWYGRTTLWARVARTGTHKYGKPEGYLFWNKWSDQGNRIIVDISKVNGTWSFHRGTTSGGSMLLEPVGCSFVSEVAKVESGPAPYFDRQGFFFFPGKHAGWYSMGTERFALCGTREDVPPVIHLDQEDRSGTFYLGRPGTSGRPDFLAPGLPIGALVGKFGVNGAPFVLMDGVNSCGVIGNGDELFIGINDSNYSDNSGEFKLIVKKERSEKFPIPDELSCPSLVSKENWMNAYVQTREDNFHTGMLNSSFGTGAYITNEYGTESKGLARWEIKPPKCSGCSEEHELIIKNPARQCLRLKVRLTGTAF